MAELAALGVAASILQVIDVSVRVISSLNDYRKKAHTLPKALEHISNRLPALIDALKGTKQALDSMTDDARNAITPCVAGCLVQIQALEAITEKVTSKTNDSATIRVWKAIISVKYGNDIKEMDKNIQEYIQTLTNHSVLSGSNRTLANQRPPPKPDSTCPFPRQPDFIERDVMNQVMSRCQPGKRLALMGIGGVGKSHIAIEYSYRVRKASPQTWVFWVSMESSITAARDFCKIAKAVHIPGCDEKGADIFGSVRDWLKNDAHGPWTMVLDNVDDVNVLTASAPNSASIDDDTNTSPLPQIREFLTISQTGSILITSRNTEAAQMITGNCAYHIDVEEMNEAEAIALLKSKLHSKVLYEEGEAADLVKAIDYMPLAISQIAANINLNYPRLTVPGAIEKLQNPSQETIQLLETDAHETSRDAHRSNSIIKIWHLSFQYVSESNPSAARLLSLMCLFNRQEIPEKLLGGQYEEEAAAVVTRHRPHFVWWKRIRRPRLLFRRSKSFAQRKTDTKVKPSDFDADWRVLTNFALIKTNLDGHHFSMHRLVQHATRRWLELKEEIYQWKVKYIRILTDHFPTPEYENQQICQSLLQHAQQAFSYQFTDKIGLRIWASLISKVSEYALYVGNFSAAKEFSQGSLAIFQQISVEQNEDTLKGLHDLGRILVRLKQYQEAEPLARRAFEGRQALLGVDHLHSLASATLLGAILIHLKRYDEGEALQLRAMEAQQRILGPRHFETYCTMNSLILGAIVDGRYDQATKLHCRMSDVREDITGDELEDKYEEMQMLASLLSMKGDLDSAERIHREVVDVMTKRYTPHDCRTAQSVNFLAEVLLKQGKLQEAEERYRSVVDIHSDFEGSKRREEALNSMYGLSQVLLEQGKEKEAEDIGQKVILGREALLGADHFDTLVGVHAMAKILTQQGRREEALPLYERAYVGLEKVSGPDHPDVQEFLNDFRDAQKKLLGQEIPSNKRQSPSVFVT